MTSIVICAHNEANVIGRCLDKLLEGALPGEFDVTVVANGCEDATAEVAASREGVRVLEIGQASKPMALNEGDGAAVGYPRIYLDADIEVSTAGVRRLAEVVAGQALGTSLGSGLPAPLACVPRRRLDTTGRPVIVRAFFAINSRLPAFQQGLFGRGMIALSEEGRKRFERFPDVVADDLFLDSLFGQAEKCQVEDVTTVVATPRRTRDLVRRLVRVRRGNASLRKAARTGEFSVVVRPAKRASWLRDVLLPRPWLAPAALVYAAVTIVAAAAARRPPDGEDSWGRDESTRERVPGGAVREVGA